MDDQQTNRIDEAARKFAEALAGSYRTTTGRAVSAQELNTELTRNFFGSVVENLRKGAEGNRAASQELANQQRRQLEAARALAQESTNAYMEFLNSMFFLYRRSEKEAERSTEAVLEASPERSPEGGPESQVDGELPLEDYDSLNVREIGSRLGELNVEEIERLRAYEARNKNRQTLMKRFDARIEADSS